MKRWLVAILSILLLVPVAYSQDDCTDNCEGTEVASADTAETIFSEPSYETLTPIRDLIHDRWYKRVNGRVDVYDAPNGNITRVIEDGFNFITALQDENGWTRINGDEYVRSDQLEDSNWVLSNFTGTLIPESGFEYPIAWILVNLYPSPEPGANPSEQFDFHPRYTRVHIYDTDVVDGYRWYQIGDGQWVHQYHVSKVTPLKEIPTDIDTDLWVGIDVYEQNLIVYRGKTPIFATLVATGLPRWPTYEGTFNIYYRNPREYMSWGVVGDDFYSLEEVPWTMFFDEGRALHGAYWHDGFGYRRSHGCVNMSVTDAKWLYDLVVEEMDGKRRSADIEEGPAVYVYSTDEYQ